MHFFIEQSQSLSSDETRTLATKLRFSEGFSLENKDSFMTAL